VEIARFTSATGWAGRSITYDDGRFSLQDFGPIAAAAVLEYDRQGQLEWAYPGLREWVTEVAAAASVAGGAGSAATSPGQVTPTGQKMPVWAIVLIVVGALVFGVGGCAAIAIPMFLNQHEKAQESSVKEGVHWVQIAVQSYAVDNGDVYPEPDLVSPAGLASYADNWPTNPYTGEPMAQGDGPGDFTYSVGPEGAWFRLVGHGEDGREVISAGY
jgi:hypothetical protein